MTTPQPPAGWYTDPDGSGGQRYWDGYAWTEHQTPAPQAPPPPPPPRSSMPPPPPPPSTSPEPPSPPRRTGAHRAPDDEPETPAQPTTPARFAATSGGAAEDSTHAVQPDAARAPTDAGTAFPTSPPPTSGEPNGAGSVDRPLLMRYLAVCAGLLAVLVAVAVYAAFFADDGSTSIEAFDDPTTTLFPTMSPTTSAGDGWGGQEPDIATETPTATPTFPEDSDATDGPLAFSVDTVEITPSVSSVEFPVDKTATGEYVVVHLTVTNTSDEPATFLGTFQKLMAGDAVYSIDDEATFYAGGALAELNPGDQADVAVVFDVPPGTDPETIELRSDPLSPGVEVSLP